MPSAQGTFIIDNTGAPATSGQFGPLTVPLSNSLLRVQALGSFIPPPASIALPFQLSNDATWGIQMGPTGYTPKVLPADIDDPAFLIAEQRDDGTTNTVYTPTTATVVYQYSSGLNISWVGQRFVGAVVDFYFTYGGSHGGGIVVAVCGTLQVWIE